MNHVWLGLGGNIGDVSTNMALALNYMVEDGQVEIVAVSSQYRTPPWGKTDQPWFINACVEIRTSLEPVALISRCMEVEARLKRERVEHWGPRSMDIDILVYEGITLESQRLTIPHPRMLERAFVLIPLGEIAPDLFVCGKAVRDWIARLDGDEMELHLDALQWY